MSRMSSTILMKDRNKKKLREKCKAERQSGTKDINIKICIN